MVETNFGPTLEALIEEGLRASFDEKRFLGAFAAGLIDMKPETDKDALTCWCALAAARNVVSNWLAVEDGAGQRGPAA